MTALRPAVLALALAVSALVAEAHAASVPARVGDLTVRRGDIPRRLVGYGLVVGLDGTGDRSFGGIHSTTPTVRSVVNLLRRFDVEVPAERLRLRNVAAVLVTAEVSPYLRSGGRFEVQVSALGDATSLRGGVLWITPLVTDPDQPPVATAQGPVLVAPDETARGRRRLGANSARIVQGGVLEVDPPSAGGMSTTLLLKSPDLATASGIAAAVNAAFGDGTARVDDPGAVTLTPGPERAGDVTGFLTAVDTLRVAAQAPSRIVIDGREGTVVVGGDVWVGTAVVSHRGITLQIGGVPTPDGARPPGLVRMEPQASVQDVAAGLHAAGAGPEEITTIFEALRAAGALNAEVVIR